MKTIKGTIILEDASCFSPGAGATMQERRADAAESDDIVTCSTHGR